MLKKTLLAAAASVMLTAGVAQAADYKPLEKDPEVLNFGIIATESTIGLKEQWMPLLKDMEKTIGMKVVPFFAPDYAGVIEAMRFGKVHLAWFGNKSGMEAVDRAGGEVFAQTSKADGSQGYYAHVITNVKNTNINSLKDILKCDHSIDFGLGDPNSTSGFLVPSYYVFAKNDFDPKKCFKTMRNSSHEVDFMSVAHNQVDAAESNSETMGRAAIKHPEEFKKVKIIWTSPLIPSDPMVYRKDLSKELKSKIKGFFLSYGRFGPNKEHQIQVLRGMSDGQGYFMESNNTQLYPIRQLQLFKNKMNIKASAMAEADKETKVKKIDQQLAELDVLVKHQ